jgi:molybdate transport system substrate-binding protein
MNTTKQFFFKIKTPIIIAFFLLMMSAFGFADQKNKYLMIYAPASLRDAVDELIILYEKKHPTKAIKPVYMGTSQLALQIKNGANPDIFISANSDWMDYLEGKQLIIKKYRINYLYNSLVGITKKGNNQLIKIKDIKGFKKILLTTKSRISLAMTISVPAGIYTKNYLENINIWKDIKDNIVESPNVRAAMNFVSRGDLDLGIVYYSDAISENKIKIIYFLDEHYHGKIIYPLTVLNEEEETLSFYNFLIEKNSKSIMRKWGFKTNR